MAAMTSLFSIVPLLLASYRTIRGSEESTSQKSNPRIWKSLLATSLNPSGMHPVSSLLLRYKDSKLERLPNSPGIVPVSRLWLRYKNFRLERLPNSPGIVPVSRLLLRSRDFRLERLPNSPGIGQSAGCC